MKQVMAIAAALLAVVFVLAPGVVSAASSEGAHDFAVGGFERGSGAHTGFSAQSGPSGENAFGHLSSTLAGAFQQRYDVTCLAVAGNHAAIGLVPTDAGSNDATLETVLVVVDSGLPGGTGDLYGFVLNPGVQAANCALYVGATPPFTPLSGNIVVKDVSP
jgi:hypothetical protein